MKKILILFILSFINNNFLSQNKVDEKLNFIPQAPEVAALMKFVDQPISYATGIPNINVPIYNLNLDGKLDIPVNLSYNSGGITVDQVSTWVGLGWNLNGGGL